MHDIFTSLNLTNKHTILIGRNDHSLRTDSFFFIAFVTLTVLIFIKRILTGEMKAETFYTARGKYIMHQPFQSTQSTTNILQ
jgi:hypothetical protein